MYLITSQEDFNKLIFSLAKENVLYMDTEFYRRDTYFAKLCLVQIATNDGKHYVIDTLAELDFKALGGLLNNPDIVKVLHSAEQDIQIFYQLFGEVPANLFDTQVAANVCNMGKAVGYGKLCKDLLDENVDKSLQSANWRKRPLSLDLLEYAVMDVKYLPQIYQRLKGQIDALGLGVDFRKKMQRVSSKETYIANPERIYSRMRITDLKGKQYDNMIALIAFREDAAQKLDVPRGHFLTDIDLLKLSERPPASNEEFEKCGVYSITLQKRGYKAKLLELCAGLREV